MMLERKRMKKMTERVNHRVKLLLSACDTSCWSPMCSTACLHTCLTQTHNVAGDDDEEDDEAEGGTGKRAAEDDDEEVRVFVRSIFLVNIAVFLRSVFSFCLHTFSG